MFSKTIPWVIGSVLAASTSMLHAQEVSVSNAVPVLRIHGSNTIGEHLAPALIDEWLRKGGFDRIAEDKGANNERGWSTSGLRVELQAHGSNTGMRDLLEGRADIAMSSRPVTQAELQAAAAAGLGRLDSPGQEFVVALDGLAMIVNPNNPAATIELDDLRRIFTGEIRRWRQVGGRDALIRLHARDDQSGTYDTFKSLVLGDGRLSGNAIRHESTDALATSVMNDVDAIGFVGLGGIGQARTLAVRDTETTPMHPLPGVVAVEDYLLTRRLYLYLRADAPATALSLANFAIGNGGQALVERAGFVGQAVRAIPVSAAGDAPDEYRELTRDARRLSLNFRFGKGSNILDSRSSRDIDRLTAYLQQPGQAGGRVLLFGFADASEILPYLSITLANDRVDYIANQLQGRGVRVSTARGLGGSVPLASNKTEWGRYKNRRVEVWFAPAQAGNAASSNSSP